MYLNNLIENKIICEIFLFSKLKIPKVTFKMLFEIKNIYLEFKQIIKIPTIKIVSKC